ncbi:hypothetical protein E0V34_26150 [Escherichia coli]|nr:hypothetical protein [Escherichia coli]EGO8355263.1 hypothetical protein [Escherichia coli]
MTNKVVYFIHSPSPTLGRSPLLRGYFPYSLTEKYIQALQSELNSLQLDWSVLADDTESDIEMLMARDPALLICAPGLRYQFYHNGFPKQKIVWLSVMEYACANPDSVIQKLGNLECADL